MTVPILATKLYIPPGRTRLVSRSRLHTLLEQGMRQHHRLTLVSARAGAGKTTLVSEWLRHQERSTAWVSLDRSDSDPRRFFRYVIAALQQATGDVNHGLLRRLEAEQLPGPDIFASALVNHTAVGPSPCILVLDDYHLIENEWIDQALGFLIDHQPPTLHLVVTTRVDPAFPLARLRGRGWITEIRDEHLRFDTEETAGFLNGVMSLDLSQDVMSMLERRTEGWVTGLQLAAVSLQNRQQEGEQTLFAETFGGTNRFVVDYLLQEVLAQQEPVVQDFLMETSILGRVCESLCDATRSVESALSSGQSILDHLEKGNLFVIPLDDEQHWYRYHHLFADLLESMLRARRSPEEIRTLHRRAGRWFQANGLIEEAMAHAIAAEDYERAAAMIDENIVRMFSRSEVPALLSWIGQLPEEVTHERPWLDIYRAYTAVLSGTVEGVEALLAEAEARIAPEMPRAPELQGHIAAVRAYAANLRGDEAEVREMAAQTMAHLSDDYLTARGLATYALADARLSSDDIDGAQDALHEMLHIGETMGRSLMVVTPLCEMATIDKIRGRLHQAEERYQRARQWMIDHGSFETRVRCAYEFGLADLLCEWNRLDAAQEHALAGMAYRQRLGGYLVTGDLVLMRILQAQGDVAGALDALHQAERFTETYAFQMTTGVLFRASRVTQWVAAGDRERASRYASELPGYAEMEQIALARLRLAQGQAAEALRLLEARHAAAEAGRRTGRLVGIQCLQALALADLGCVEEAEATMIEALLLGWTEGYRRVYLDPGARMVAILERLTRHNASSDRPVQKIARAYADELLAAREGPADRLSFGNYDPLTERELEVLQLLAGGLTNKDMAENLVVAPSTIKQHLKNIYSKLDVHSRTQAVARGRELNLLQPSRI